jgi:hypothetical protein
MRGEEDRAPLLLHHLAELLDTAGIEAVGGLVEDQQQRIGEQAARDPEALAHAHRVALDLLVRPLGQSHPRERRSDPLDRLRTAHGGHQPKVLAAGEVRVKAGLLDDRAHPLQRLRPLGGHRVT